MALYIVLPMHDFLLESNSNIWLVSDLLWEWPFNYLVTLIWTFKVTQVKCIGAAEFSIYDFLLVF